MLIKYRIDDRQSEIQQKAIKEEEMFKPKRILMLLLIGAIVTQASACATLSPASEENSEAEETLQTIYAEQTQAAESADEEVLDTVEAGTPAAPGQDQQQRRQRVKRPPIDKPTDVPEPYQTLEDSDSSLRADENRVLSGDNFLNNLYERPFTAYEMEYQPDLDIYTVDFAYDDSYYYFTINLNGKNVDEWLLTGRYGIEFDRTLTGRGDLLVLVENPRKEWSLNNVLVFVDVNADVGGPTPIIADEGFKGDGYDLKIDLTGKLAAFARLSPDNDQAVQIAVSQELLEYPDEFLWGAWAGKELIRPVLFDHNDAFGQSEAGSPYSDDEDYPIKALFNIDNTCRLPYGFSRMSSGIPGMCITSAPTPMPGAEDEPDCFCTDYCVDGVTCCGEWICD